MPQLQGQRVNIDDFVKQYPGLEEKVRQRIHNLGESSMAWFASLLQADGQAIFSDSIPQTQPYRAKGLGGL